jgi:hypothetical protein
MLVTNRIRLFDHIVSVGTAFTGFAVGHALRPVYDPMTDSILFVAGMALWGAGALGVHYQEKRAPVEAPELPAVETRHIPNLNAAPNGFTSLRELKAYEFKTETVKQQDPRLKQWAYAVAYNGAKMTQKKWSGGKRLFSRGEYERWIACLLDNGIIAPENPRNPSGTYKPNGAAGWSEIKKIADGTRYIPLPAAVMSEAGARFVSARVREGNSAGQGSG